MDTFFIVIIILLFLLIILSFSRNFKEHFNINIFSQNVPYNSIYYDLPFNKNSAFAVCDNTCNKYVQEKWENIEKIHGWNPFGFWNGYWEQQQIKINYIPKYRLLCGCNIETKNIPIPPKK